jgi:hypothetical protein
VALHGDDEEVAKGRDAIPPPAPPSAPLAKRSCYADLERQVEEVSRALGMHVAREVISVDERQPEVSGCSLEELSSPGVCRWLEYLIAETAIDNLRPVIRALSKRALVLARCRAQGKEEAMKKEEGREDVVR